MNKRYRVSIKDIRLQSPYGCALNMFGMGRPMALVSLSECAYYDGPPYSCGHPMGVCLICLAWVAIWDPISFINTLYA